MDENEVFSADELYLVEDALRGTRGLEELYSHLDSERLRVYRRHHSRTTPVDVGVILKGSGEMRLIVTGKGATPKLVQVCHPKDIDDAISQAQSHLLDYFDAVASAL
jgi:hypothetical protein